MSELKPCPLCSEHLWPCNEGFEHPASDTCPLDNMWFPERLVAAWNTRATPTLSAAMDLPEVRALSDAIEMMMQAVCGETGFANCVRINTGKAYPWPALDIAEEKAIAALAALTKENKT